MLGFFSLTTTPIEVLAENNSILGNATGFFYKNANSKSYLITNWHVLSGRNPLEPKKSINGAIPCKLRCTLHCNVDEKRISLSKTDILTITINSPDGNSPAWIEHREHRYKVDVCAIPIDNIQNVKNYKFSYINEYPHYEFSYVPEVMDTVFVIGYPWGLSGGSEVLPLYKRGSIASEPQINISKLPKLLIDCRTSEAMSGSVVLVSHSGIWCPEGKPSPASVLGTIINFIGVYSGRLIEQSCDLHKREISEIGIVWKKQALDEIVNQGVTGTQLKDLI